MLRYSSLTPKQKMVYEWDSKEAECYRLYVEEKKSLDEVMQQMKELHGFSPRYANFASLLSGTP